MSADLGENGLRLSIPGQWSYFIPPENITKTKVFLLFSGGILIKFAPIFIRNNPVQRSLLSYK